MHIYNKLLHEFPHLKEAREVSDQAPEPIAPAPPPGPAAPDLTPADHEVARTLQDIYQAYETLKKLSPEGRGLLSALLAKI